MYTKVIISWILLCQLLIKSSTGLQCYMCGTESFHETDKPNMDPTDIEAHSGSCHDFETKIVFPGYKYIVNCDENPYHLDQESEDEKSSNRPLCVKLVTRSAHTGQFYTQRGCSSSMTSTGKTHLLSCGPTMMSRDVFMSNGDARDDPTNKAFNITGVEHICFCDSNYCNESTSWRRRSWNTSVIVLPVLHLLFMYIFESII